MLELINSKIPFVMKLLLIQFQKYFGVILGCFCEVLAKRHSPKHFGCVTQLTQGVCNSKILMSREPYRPTKLRTEKKNARKYLCVMQVYFCVYHYALLVEITFQHESACNNCATDSYWKVRVIILVLRVDLAQQENLSFLILTVSEYEKIPEALLRPRSSTAVPLCLFANLVAPCGWEFNRGRGRGWESRSLSRFCFALVLKGFGHYSATIARLRPLSGLERGGWGLPPVFGCEIGRDRGLPIALPVAEWVL